MIKSMIIYQVIFCLTFIFYSLILDDADAEEKRPSEKVLDDLADAFNERDNNRLWGLFGPEISKEVKSEYEHYIKKPSYARLHIDIFKTEQEEDKAKIFAYEYFDFSTEKKKKEFGAESCGYVEYKLIKKDDKWIITDKTEPVPPFDAENYDISIKLLPDNRIIIGNFCISIKSLVENPKFLVMATNNSIRFTKVMDSSGNELDFLQDNSMTKIYLEMDYPVNSTFTLDIDYAGGLFNPSEIFSLVNIGHEGSFASFGTFWYPRLIGQPKLDTPGATGTISINAPAGKKGFSNGRLIYEKTDETGYTCQWKVDYPADFSFALGDYTAFESKIDDIPVVVYMLPHNAHLAEYYAKEMGKVFRVEKEIYGHFPFEKFGLVELPSDVTINLGGAGEQGFLFIPDRMNSELFNTQLYAHELGHCWWGNYIKFKNNASFFAESLAQYSVCMVLERLYDWEKISDWMKKGVWNYKQSARYYFYEFYKQKDMPYGDQLGIITPKQRGDMHYLSDLKGFWLFHTLRSVIGEEAFFGALKKLAMGDYGRQLGIEDIKKAFSDSSDYDIEIFWSEWFDRTGVPEYELKYKIYSKKGKYEIKGTLTQTGDLYTTPIEIGIKTKDEMIIEKVYPKEMKTDFSFIIDKKPVDLVVDPRNFILKLSDDGRNFYKLGQCDKLYNEKKYDEAQECLTPLLPLMNDEYEIFLTYKNILIKKRNYMEAEKVLLECLKKELEKDLLERNQRLIQSVRLSLGYVYDYQGKRDKAIEQYKEILEMWYSVLYYTERAKKGLKEPFKEE